MQERAISGYVLAGGKSSRLKRDKVTLPWTSVGQGTILLRHAVARLEAICTTVRVCGDRGDFKSLLPPSALPAIRDAIPNTGPLGGIVAALAQSRTPWNLFLAVDLPLLPVELLRALATHATDARINAGVFCILPQLDGLPQPLCGIYHASLLPGLREALEEGKYKIMDALRKAVSNVEGRPTPLDGVSLERSSVARLDTPASRVELFDVRAFADSIGCAAAAEDWFLNINTPEDWRRAVELASP